MNENNAHTCRYRFLLEKPILYSRPITLTENIVTNVKFLIISYNRMHNEYAIFLYNENERVNWDEILNKKFDYLRLRCSDSFFLESYNIEWLLEHFGLK